VAAAAAVGAAPPPAAPPAAPDGAWPFGIGERFTYAVHTQRFGGRGRGVMFVSGPDTVAGTPVVVLHFLVEAGVGPLKGGDHTTSWIDPLTGASLRYERVEQHPLARRRRAVRVYPDERRWEAADGATGATAAEPPLDELSFIHHVRTLPLDGDSVVRLDRHYDARKRPAVVRRIGRDSVTVPAGRFAVVEYALHVRDGDAGERAIVIRLHVSADACRIPVRMESPMPVLGATVLTLVEARPAHRHPGCPPA
jgi:hypothetical protein